ncbi:MAG: thiamine-phosphate kinase [Desulfobulbaceae bacterium]|nr:thiamine-phosphate kinase [Desulfobulbaceae bacterium]
MNEREIISLFNGSAGPGGDELVRGIGDDCAVLRLDGDRLWLVTVDTLIESVHFNIDWHPPRKLGRKSVAVNVSDIAAMGGSPRFAFLSLGLPQGFDPPWLEKFSQGLSEACREFGCTLAGGDTVRTVEGVMITLTVIGEVPADQVTYRSTALPGDEIWVSGTLGNAAAGLELCTAGDAGSEDGLLLAESHLNPTPRLGLARRLAGGRLVHAMMDLSDGVATDLSHLCIRSGTGAVIYADLLPVSGPLQRTAGKMGKDCLPWALTGGEDYELLFTAAPGQGGAILRLAEKEGLLTRIGYIDAKSGVRLAEGRPGRQNPPQKDVSFLGYDHFRL